MIIAFIADIHSNLEALTSVLNYIERINPEKIYCAGDICGYNANPNECIELIRRLKIPSVLGNHDLATITGITSGFNIYAAMAIEQTRKIITDKNIEFLKSLPERIEVNVDNFEILVVHGSPKDPINEYIYKDDINENFIGDLSYCIIVMGHTHIPFVKRIDNRLVINAGAVGQPRDHSPKACFALLDLDRFDCEIIRVDYGVKTAAEKIVKAGFPRFLAQRLFLGI